jgi:ATP-dependent DNA ligase
VLDCELVLPGGSFETMQLRLHLAESRIRLLSQETPAQLIVFDILARAGASPLQRALADRRRELEDFMTAMPGALHLGDATLDAGVVRQWLGRKGLDGIVAKRLDLPARRARNAEI